MTTLSPKLLLLSLLLSLGHTASAAPMRYQGQLSDGGQPANGLARWDGRRFASIALPGATRDWVTHLWADAIHLSPNGHAYLGALASNRTRTNPF